MTFNPKKDNIAIVLPEFTLLKSSDFITNRYNEPYIVSLAIDEGGTADPNIMFNVMPFPKVRPGSTVRMLGDGHLLYGPKNPGDFVALSVLIMEHDGDVRDTGKIIEKIVKSRSADLSVAALLAANPGSAAILGILKELTQFVAGALKNNKDDELFRVEGAYLRDGPVPYHINRKYDDLGNDFVRLAISVLPLSKSNMEGAQIKSIKI